MIRSRAFIFPLLLAVALSACGGGSGPSTTSTTTTTPVQNPCATALTANDIPELTGLDHVPATATDKTRFIDGNPLGRMLEAQWTHRDAVERRAAQPAAQAQLTGRPAVPADSDVGDIAVLQDQGDMIIPVNPFDLQSTGLRFTPSGSGFNVAKIDGTFRTTLGRQLTLTDDDSASVDVPFGFPFYGTSQTAAFVNSDGNITFQAGDNQSTDRSVARMLTGPPRVSPFFTDLDPTLGGGKVFVNAASDQYTVTWCGVHAFGAAQTVTVQAALLPSGVIEFKFDTATIGDAIVGVSPGNTTSTFTPLDLDKAPLSGDGAVGEHFASSAQVDSIALARRFYATHPDNYDNLVIFADQRIIPRSVGAFAYTEGVANAVRGIGLPQFNATRDYGSGGQLHTVMVMDALSKYFEDQSQKVNSEFTSLAIIAHETGHEWLAYVRFRDRAGLTSKALLTDDLAHWGFFVETSASFMYGHDFQDNGGGSFKTLAAAQRFSRLDQYLMGLVPPSAVPAFYYVEGGTGASASDLPQVGVAVTGTRRDVLVDDVIAVEGARNPSSDASPHTLRQGWIYVQGRTATLDPAQVAKLDNLRRQFEPYMLQATEGRLTTVTTLR